MMNDINLAAAPIDTPFTQLLTSLLQEARAGKIQGIAVVVSRGPETWNAAWIGENPCALSAGCARTAFDITMKSLAPQQSPIIRAFGEVPRNN